MKYSDAICQWLKEMGYTHCFFVAGGNIMHLLESASKHFCCVPVVHEVSAGIAAEYFTEAGGKAFAMVTAAPGITNMVTAIAGAYLESRELLVIGGQVKTTDMAEGRVRQRGIQELDGVELVSSITKKAQTVCEPWTKGRFKAFVEEGALPRKAPIFIEIPLDVQGMGYACD